MNLDEITVGESVRAQLSAAGQTTNLWPLLVNRERAVVAVDDEGLRLFGTDAEAAVFPWSEVAEVRVEQMALCVVLRADPATVRYPLMRIGDRRALAEAIAAAGGPIVAPEPVKHAPIEGPVDRDRAGTARSLLTSAFVSGMAGLLVGWSVIGVGWVGDEEESPVVMLLGIAITTLGGFALLLALIGWGVMLGIRATRED